MTESKFPAFPGALTQAEIDFLNLSDAQITAESEIFSFDGLKLRERMMSDDNWTIIIQGHLYLDHIISKMIKDTLQTPEAINVGRMGFTQRLELILALGLISKELFRIARQVNTIRNRLAHTLDFQISETDVRDLINATPKAIREVNFRNPDAPRTSEISLGELIELLATLIDIERQKASRKRALERRVQLAARNRGYQLLSLAAQESSARPDTDADKYDAL